jgi:2-oxoisovalerate dehydrogenase E1 component
VELAKKHGKLMVLTEETLKNSFAEAIAGRATQRCFQYLDAPIKTFGSEDIPAVPLNMGMEQVMLPNVEKVKLALQDLLEF